MTEQIISSQLDYASKTFNHPSPLYVKITPIGGTTSPTLSLTSVGTLSEFQVPAKVVNLAQSYLSFDLSFAAGGATLISCLQGNLATTINRIVVSTIGSNVVLADISNAGNYVEAVSAHSTKMQDLLDKSNGSNVLNETSLANAQLTPVEDIARVNDANNYTGQLYTGTGGGDDVGAIYTGIKQLYFQASQNAASFISVRIPLSAFKHSIMAIDKNMYFAGEMLNVAIYWEACNKWVFVATAKTNPTTNAANAPSAPTMSNLALYTQCEQNISITSAIIEKVNTSGVSIPIPLVWSSKQNIASSTAHSVTLNITRSHGNKLLFVAWSPFNNVESLSSQKAHTTYLHLQYSTYLNQIPIISNAGIDVSKAEHWYYNKANLDKSGIQSLVSYNNKFTHFDNFTGMSLPELGDNLTVSNGLDLTQEQQQWQLNATTTSVSLNHYIFWVCQKQLTIAPNNIMLA